MPWAHCENDRILDDVGCPTCGMTKTEWTVQLDTTRRLVIGKKKQAWIEATLCDGDARPVPGQPYLLELPDGRVVRGRLDARGLARADRLYPGLCKVRFPSAAEARAWWVPPEVWGGDGRDGGGGTPGRGDADAEHGTDSGSGSGSAHWLELELRDDAGRGVAGQAWLVQLPDGRRRGGWLDADGQARVEGICAAGACRVLFPGWSGTGYLTQAPGPAAPPRRDTGRAGAGPAGDAPVRAGGGPEPRPWVELELVDTDGWPVPERPYVLELPDGTRRSGWLDADGRARVEGVPAGVCRVLFPGEAAGPLDAAPLAVRALDAGPLDADLMGRTADQPLVRVRGQLPAAPGLASVAAARRFRPTELPAKEAAPDLRAARLRDEARAALDEARAAAGRRAGLVRDALRQANAHFLGAEAAHGMTLRLAPVAPVVALPADAPELEAALAATGAPGADPDALASALAAARAAQARREAERDLLFELYLAVLGKHARCDGWPRLAAALDRALAAQRPEIARRLATETDLDELLGAWVFEVDGLAEAAFGR